MIFPVVLTALAVLAAVPAHARGLLPGIGSRSVPEAPQRPADVPADAQLEREQARVGRIVFDINDIFATDTPDEDVAMFRFANFLHIRTNQGTIERQLLFRSGDPYSRQKLDESERLLRTQRYLGAVRIEPIAYRDGLVDVRVYTRDVWTLKPGISFGRSGGTNTVGAGIEESNLFGLGKELSFDYKSNVDRRTTAFGYRDPQLFGSRWVLTTALGSNSDGRKNSWTLERPFYELDARWSAGLRFSNETRIDPIYDMGKVTDQYRISERAMTAYYGLSDGLRDGWARRWTAGITSDEKTFEALPGQPDPGVASASRKLVYPWIGYELAQDRFQPMQNLTQIGRTEDVFLGFQANAQIGIAATQIGSDRNALVFKATLARNATPGEGQIVTFDSKLSGRLEGRRLQNAQLNLAARYFARQSASWLGFVGLQVDSGLRLDPDQRLMLGGDTGLRGYPLRYQGGTGRWLLTAEERFFTDWYPFRLVRVGGAVFFDAGRTWGANSLGSPPLGLLRDVGFGLRIGQSRSGLGAVTHINLAFPLDARGDIKKWQLVVETKSSF